MNTIHPLKRFRKNNRLSQTELAKMIGLSVASVCRIEAGKQNVTPEVAVKIERGTNGEISRFEFLPREFLASSAA